MVLKGNLLKAMLCVFVLLLSIQVFAQSSSQSQTIQYRYDELGRLVTTEDSKNGDRVYKYDAAGNRTLVVAGFSSSSSKLSSSSVSTSCSGVSLKIEAENYSSMFGVQAETTTDAGGGKNLGYMHPGDWMLYENSIFTAPVSGLYKLTFRLASTAGGIFRLHEADGSLQYGTISVPVTGGLQVWADVTKDVFLNAGSHKFGLTVEERALGFNLNWFRVAPKCSNSSSNSVVSASSYSASSLGSSFSSGSRSSLFSSWRSSGSQLSFSSIPSSTTNTSSSGYSSISSRSSPPAVSSSNNVSSSAASLNAASSFMSSATAISSLGVSSAVLSSRLSSSSYSVLASSVRSSSSSSSKFSSSSVVPQVSAPVFDPTSDTIFYESGVVKLEQVTPGSSMFYSVNGSSYMPYSTSGIAISGNSFITAMATKVGMLDSGYSVAKYNVKPLPPTFTPLHGSTFSVSGVVVLTPRTSGSELMYSINGSAYAPYPPSGISLSANSTIFAKAIRAGMSDSDEVSATYTVNQIPPPVVKGCSPYAAPGVYQGVWEKVTGANFYRYRTEDSKEYDVTGLSDIRSSYCLWVKACASANVCSEKAYFK